VLGLALLGAGSALSCSGDAPYDPTGPERPVDVSTLTTLEVTPANADLCVPGNTVQLTLVPRDQKGAPIRNSAGTATYSSSAPTIAGVSSSGVVTAAAPGTAVITAKFTLGAVTRTTSMNATVHQGSGEYPEIAGVYDLTAVVTTWDWPGSPAGLHETGVITIQHSGDTPVFTGTYADFLWFYPNGDSYGPVAGSLSGSVDCAGRVVIALRDGDFRWWDGKGTLVSGQFVGDFSESVWEDLEYFGTFSAERR
jgi:hypothetical protein